MKTQNTEQGNGTTEKWNPNLIVIADDDERLPWEVGVVPIIHTSPYAVNRKRDMRIPYGKIREAALRVMEGKPVDSPSSWLRLKVFNLSIGASVSYMVEVSVHDSITPSEWNHIGDIEFHENYKTEGDGTYEVRERVGDYKGKPNVVLIFNRYKSFYNALKDLLNNGNFSDNGRKPIDIID